MYGPQENDSEDKDSFYDGISVQVEMAYLNGDSKKDRSRHGGGVAIYVKDGIKCQKREDFNSNIEFLSVELDIKYVKPIIVTTIYRPPESNVEWSK